MIAFFTALVISYNMSGGYMESYLWFENKKHCQQAMRSDIYDVFYENYENTMMKCHVSDQASKIIRPLKRPPAK